MQPLFCASLFCVVAIVLSGYVGPPLNVTVHPMHVTVEMNNDTTNVTFICKADGASSYYWQRQGGNMSSSTVGANTSILSLHNILPADSGQYQCVAVNEHGRSYSDFTMLAIKVPPVVIVVPTQVIVPKGGHAEFNCSVVGVTADDFSYQWFLNKAIVAGQNTSTLVIDEASEYSAGDYTCSAKSSYGSIGRSQVARLILDEYCDPVTVQYHGFSVTWNKTLVGATMEAPCTGTGLNGVVRRRCIRYDRWDEFVECFWEETKLLFDQAKNLVNEINETDKIIKTSNIASALAYRTSPMQQKIFAADINLAVKTISTLNNVVETVITSLKDNDTFFEDATSVVNNLLSGTNENNWKQLERNLSTANQDLVKDAEQLTKLLSTTLNNDSTGTAKIRENLVIKVIHVSNDKRYLRMVPDDDDDLTQYTGGRVLLDVPSDLLQDTKSTNLTNMVTIISNANSLRLPAPSDGSGSHITASTIFSLQLDPLPKASTIVENNIMMTFNLRDQDPDFIRENVSCHFFDHMMLNNFNQFGGWSTKGLKVNVTDKSSITCCTSHLTSFAILVSIKDEKGPPLNVTVHPMHITVEMNNDTTNVTFTCKADGASSYYWQRQGGNMSSSTVGANTSILSLHNILPADSGHYQCVAVNEHGRSYSDFTMLAIKVPFVVIVVPTQVIVPKGGHAEFKCSVVGGTADDFSYQWFLNKAIVAGQNTSTLVIDEASEYSAGDYTCSAKSSYGSIGRSQVARLILDEYCDPVTVQYHGFSVTWNETLVGATVEAPCTGTGLNGVVRRRCIRDDQWDEFVECFWEETKLLFNQAKNLENEINETDKIIKTSNIASALAYRTSPMQQKIFAADINLAVKTISTLNNVVETVITSLKDNDTFFEDATSVMNNLLSGTNENNWKQLERNLSTANQDLVRGAEKLTKLLSTTLNNDSTGTAKIRENLVIKVIHVSNDKRYLRMVPDDDDDLTQYTGGRVLLDVPSDLLQDTKSTNLTNMVTIISNANSLRLPAPSDGSGSHITASTIFSLQLDPLPKASTIVENNIMMTFNLRDQDPDFIRENVSCHFFDHMMLNNFNQFGGWSTDGLKVNVTDKSSITCCTSHLTSFAILVNIKDEQSPSTEDKALSIISYVGCAISLLCLGLSIIMLSYTIYRSKENTNLLFVHLNLCIALALGLVVFVSGIETATNNEASCKLVAALLQYLFISAFCWMLCEGVILYMMLVTVFGNKLNKKIFFFILGWGPASLIVVISAATAHEHYGSDHYCWIKTADGAILAFIIPIVSIILVNCIFLVIVLKVLFVDRQKQIRAKVDSNKDAVKSLLKAVMVLLPVLGVTWIVGILAVNNHTQVFAWIFAVFNSLQGVFIFIFHVVRNNQVTKEITRNRRYARIKKVLSNGSIRINISRKDSQKTINGGSIRYIFTGFGYFGSTLERKRNTVHESKTHEDNECKDSQTAFKERKEIMLEQCPVKDKHDSDGDAEKKESVTGENGTIVVPIEPVESPVSCNIGDTGDTKNSPDNSL